MVQAGMEELRKELSLLGAINDAVRAEIGSRTINIDSLPAFLIEWEGPMRRWQIREGFRPVVGERIDLTGNFLLLFHPRARIERILDRIVPLTSLDPGVEARRIANRLNIEIRAGLTERSITIDTVPAFIARYSDGDRQWLFFPIAFDRIGQVADVSAVEVLIFASEDIGRRVVSLLIAPPPKEVNIPFSVRQALHALQQRDDSIEYGGGLDFEILGGRAEVERLLVFLGGFGTVPGFIRGKFADDVELEFHTHPDRIIANPSLPDLIAFSSARQQADLIVAQDDMLLLFKQPGFVPLRTQEQICQLAELAGVRGIGFSIDDPVISVRQERALEQDQFINQVLRMDTERIRRNAPGPINIPLAIVQVPSR